VGVQLFFGHLIEPHREHLVVNAAQCDLSRSMRLISIFGITTPVLREHQATCRAVFKNDISALSLRSFSSAKRCLR
jgi:hypothetical protein